MAEQEETEVEETEETEETTEPKKDDPWKRLESVVNNAIDKRFEKWQAEGNGSSPKSKPVKEEKEEKPSRKPERRKGFLSDFFKGLDLD